MDPQSPQNPEVPETPPTTRMTQAEDRTELARELPGPDGLSRAASPKAGARPELDRRDFLKTCGAAGAAFLCVIKVAGAEGGKAGYNAADHYYGMAVDPAKCIGCGRCTEACRAENDVPAEGCRTWVERYTITTDGQTIVQSLDEAKRSKAPVDEKKILRTFFVPKLCNHCANAPCVQVCPVGATFTTKDGVVLVDKDYCIGCRYCIQACPYGARYLDPRTRTADKCTFCYHRITKGLAPACVEVCPAGARVFGELRDHNSPVARYLRFAKLQVLKPHLNTEPKVYYANLDGEVR